LITVALNSALVFYQ